MHGRKNKVADAFFASISNGRASLAFRVSAVFMILLFFLSQAGLLVAVFFARNVSDVFCDD